MTKVVKFPVSPPAKLGPRKVGRKRRKPDLEAFGQLNLFDQLSTSRVISFPKNGSFFDEALRLDESGDSTAADYYLKAIDAGESLADAYCNLGIIMAGQDEKTKAVDYLTKCLKENPRHFEAHYNLANVYSDLGSYELSKVHYELSTEIEPSFPNSYYNLGLVYISLKSYKEALNCIDKYIELSPGYDHTIANDLIKTLNSFA
ncbi:MAG: tetratricopeptide repeat protein [Cyclobacteriaceae bacterium]|nr:tetratricopeptide repeat protein [Cyclobacteriaceae bacterium HetDA_MAG_MS6]